MCWQIIHWVRFHLGEMCYTLTKRWAIIIIVYASHSLAQGIRRVTGNNLVRFIRHLLWKTIHIACLLSSRLQSSRIFIQTLALCPSYWRNSASSARNTSVRLMWWEKMIVLMSFPRRWCLKSSESCAYCWVCSLSLPACACTHRKIRKQYSDWRKSVGLYWNGRRDRTFCSASFPIKFDAF